MDACKSTHFLQGTFFFKITESLLAILALGIYRGGIFQPNAPDTVGGDYDFIFFFTAAMVGVGTLTMTYVVGYMLGHTPSKQEKLFNLYAALMYIVAGGWLLGETTGALDINPDYPATLRFVCGCFGLVLGLIFIIDFIFMLKGSLARSIDDEVGDY